MLDVAVVQEVVALLRGDALPELPSWAGWGHTWAPSVLRRDDTFVMYYTVRYEASGRQAISVATASDPAGPFVDRSAEPLIFLPRVVRIPGGACSLYPADAGWEERDPERPGRRHRLLMVDSGWQYLREG